MRLIRTGSPGRPPRLPHSSEADADVASCSFLRPQYQKTNGWPISFCNTNAIVFHFLLTVSQAEHVMLQLMPPKKRLAHCGSVLQQTAHVSYEGSGHQSRQGVGVGSLTVQNQRISCPRLALLALLRSLLVKNETLTHWHVCNQGTEGRVWMKRAYEAMHL